MLSGKNNKKHYTWYCVECETTWTQLHPNAVGQDGDAHINICHRAIHPTDKRRSNGYRCNIRKGGCGLLLNKTLAELRNENMCVCKRRKRKHDTASNTLPPPPILIHGDKQPSMGQATKEQAEEQAKVQTEQQAMQQTEEQTKDTLARSAFNAAVRALVQEWGSDDLSYALIALGPHVNLRRMEGSGRLALHAALAKHVMPDRYRRLVDAVADICDGKHLRTAETHSAAVSKLIKQLGGQQAIADAISQCATGPRLPH